MNTNVYVHELVEIILHNRAKYMDHMAAYAPIAREEKGMLCLGIWGTVGTTERWPETVNVWELPGWKGVARNLRHEFNHPTLQDPSLAVWWAEAQKYRSGGWDRLLIPSPSTPTVEQATAQRIHGETYYHEMIKVVPGQARTYLSMLEEEWLPVTERYKQRLVGAYRTAMVNDSEVIVISAIDTWEDWAEFEAAQDEDPDILRWRRRTQGLVVDWRNKLMCASQHVPMLTGKIL